MKYRISIRKSKGYPYSIEYNEKESRFGSWFNTWEEIDTAETVSKAELLIKKHYDSRNIPKLVVGSIVKEFTEADFLVEKLQDKY
jgi:hypothetical protein